MNENQTPEISADEKAADPVALRQRKRRRQRIAGIVALAIIAAIVVVLQLLGSNAKQERH